MKKYRSTLWIFSAIIFMSINGLGYSQTKGLRTITEKELRYHLDFLGAQEFRGRETPSHELEIATHYIGNWAKYAGLKPLMQDGSFYQEVPLKVTAVSATGTKMKVIKGGSEFSYYFEKSFGGNFQVSGSYYGNVIFAGLGISDPENGWDDLDGLDLSGKIVLILDEQRPGSETEASAWLTSRVGAIVNMIRQRGASAVLSVVSPEKLKRISTAKGFYSYLPTGRLGTTYDSQRTDFTVPSTEKLSRKDLFSLLLLQK